MLGLAGLLAVAYTPDRLVQRFAPPDRIGQGRWRPRRLWRAGLEASPSGRGWGTAPVASGPRSRRGWATTCRRHTTLSSGAGRAGDSRSGPLSGDVGGVVLSSTDPPPGSTVCDGAPRHTLDRDDPPHLGGSPGGVVRFGGDRIFSSCRVRSGRARPTLAAARLPSGPAAGCSTGEHPAAPGGAARRAPPA